MADVVRTKARTTNFAPAHLTISKNEKKKYTGSHTSIIGINFHRVLTINSKTDLMTFHKALKAPAMNPLVSLENGVSTASEAEIRFASPFGGELTRADSEGPRLTGTFHGNNRCYNRRPQLDDKQPEDLKGSKTDDVFQSALEAAPALRLLRKASSTFDKSRAPLKKRQTTPIPGSAPSLLTQVSSGYCHIHTLLRASSSTYPTPILRSSSSTFSTYQHHDMMVPPQLRLSSSKGHQLMSEPLLETPQATPFFLPQTSACSFSDPQNSYTNIPLSSCQNYRDFSAAVASVQLRRSTTEDHSQSGSLRFSQVANAHGNGGFKTPLGPVSSTERKAQSTNASMPKTRLAIGSPSTAGMASIPHSFPHSTLSDFRTPITAKIVVPPYSVVTERSKGSGFDFSTGRERSLTLQVPKDSRDESAGRDLFQNVSLTDRPCKCSNSRCLKLYCECFHYGFFCDERLCRCSGCCNNESHNEPRGERILAIKKILARRPDAFHVRVKRRSGKGCSCKKSG